MKKNEQGVLHQGKLFNSIIHILWIITFCHSQSIHADNSFRIIDHAITNDQHEHIAIVYSSESTLTSEIAEKIINAVTDKNIDIAEITPAKTGELSNKIPDLVIAIGIDNIQIANEKYSNSSKLLIASNPGEYRPAINPDVQTAVMYMTQPYCRQIHFIKLINSQWNTFSYLSSENNPVDEPSIKQCATKYDMATYKVTTSSEAQLTNNIKNALSHSDLILALPDKSIYNTRSVKNILLTCYRKRKPIIGFSHNFVNAGALASIHSNAEQIALTASTLVKQYFERDRKFNNPVNYPQAFDISINRQVFRALELPIPDVDKLKQVLEHAESANKGEPR